MFSCFSYGWIEISEHTYFSRKNNRRICREKKIARFLLHSCLGMPLKFPHIFQNAKKIISVIYIISLLTLAALNSSSAFQQFEFPDGLLICFWPLLQRLDSLNSPTSTEVLQWRTNCQANWRLANNLVQSYTMQKIQDSGADLIYNFWTICEFSNQNSTNHTRNRKNRGSCSKRHLLVPSKKVTGYGDVIIGSEADSISIVNLFVKKDKVLWSLWGVLHILH